MNLPQTIQQIDLLKKEAHGLMPISEENERNFWWKFRLDFNYNSNHLEGNTLTYGHTQILLKSGNVVGKYNIRELQEMKAHDLALKNIREAAEDPEFTLTQKFIKEINEIILVEPFYNDAMTSDGRKTKKLITPGQYKSTPNSVLMANGEMFYYPSPEETPALMGDLIDWFEKESKEQQLHPVHLAALFHYKFVRIHPFDDSNGRTARLLMNYILLKNKYAPLVIESIDKKNYLIALNEADAGNVEAFVEYISGIALKWQEKFLKGMKGENLSEPDDFDKEIAVIKKQHPKNYTRHIFEINRAIELFENSFFPLLKSAITKLGKMDDFYEGKKILIGINKPNILITKVNEIDNVFKAHYAMSVNVGSDLQLTFSHLEMLKTKKDGINYNSFLKIEFKQYTYAIMVNTKKEFIEKSYAEVLSEKEITEICDELGTNELAFIKIKLS